VKDFTKNIVTNLSSLFHGLGTERAWNAEYARGEWEFLFSVDELPRYMLLAGYVQHVARPARVLDIGCGAGRLYDVVAPFGITRYRGVDLSSAAIEKAKSRVDAAHVTFEVGDAANWDTDEEFDVVVFNEMLYYLREPYAAASRLAARVGPGGHVLVSVYDHPAVTRVWKLLKPGFEVVASTRVENARGHRWDVRMFKRK
jgi:2-polyprenyl-3-methyl-5-hydroxy-6-metoxy-1,4-benzoquinol methylase